MPFFVPANRPPIWTLQALARDRNLSESVSEGLSYHFAPLIKPRASDAEQKRGC